MHCYINIHIVPITWVKIKNHIEKIVHTKSTRYQDIFYYDSISLKTGLYNVDKLFRTLFLYYVSITLPRCTKYLQSFIQHVLPIIKSINNANITLTLILSFDDRRIFNDVEII